MYPRTSYIIYATQRTGSTLLCDALSKTMIAGHPDEFFTLAHAQKHAIRWGLPLRDYNLGKDYFKRMYTTTTTNGVFGVKILWDTFAYCLEQIRLLEGNEHTSLIERLQTAFPYHHSLWITRRDKVQQAVSWWRADETGVWWTVDGKVPKGGAIKKELDFDFQKIEQYRQKIIAYEQNMQCYFFTFGIKPFTVVYEDFVTAYEETTIQILDYLHISVPKDFVPGGPRLEKQADIQTEEWVQRYYQTKQEQETTVKL